jgi:hypothetical protein
MSGQRSRRAAAGRSVDHVKSDVLVDAFNAPAQPI